MILYLLSMTLCAASQITLTKDPFSYGGSYEDHESTTQYLFARSYAEREARFISQDSYGYFNRYAAFLGDPIGNVDPDGHSAKHFFKKNWGNVLNASGALGSMVAGLVSYGTGGGFLLAAGGLMALDSGFDILNNTNSSFHRGYSSGLKTAIDVITAVTAGALTLQAGNIYMGYAPNGLTGNMMANVLKSSAVFGTSFVGSKALAKRTDPVMGALSGFVLGSIAFSVVNGMTWKFSIDSPEEAMAVREDARLVAAAQRVEDTKVAAADSALIKREEMANKYQANEAGRETQSSSTTIKEIEDAIVDVKGQIRLATDKLIDRQERLDVLVSKSEKVGEMARIFHRRAAALNARFSYSPAAFAKGYGSFYLRQYGFSIPGLVYTSDRK